MHVCQMIDGFSSAGAQRLVVYFAEQAKLNGVKVTAVGLREPTTRLICDELERQGARVVISSAAKLYDPRRILRLVRYFKSNRVDIIQSHLSYANILAAVVGRLAGIPVISTLHTSNYKNQFYRPAIFRTEMAALRFLSSEVVAVARAVANVYAPFLGGKKIAIIPNPVRPVPEIQNRARGEIRRRYLPRPEAPLLVAVGRLTEPKGYADMIRAFAQAAAVRPDARLLIAGRGEEEENLQNLISASGLDGRVFLLGERGDVPELLAASDLFLSASHWEGMPFSVLEAMSAGLPVLATAVGGIPEILENRGVMVPPRDPDIMAVRMVELLEHPDGMKEIERLAREYVAAEHDPQKWFSKMTALFSALMEGK